MRERLQNLVGRGVYLPTITRMPNYALTVSGVLALIAFSAASAQQDAVRASNMSLVGYNDLQARSAYQPVIENKARAGSLTSATMGESNPTRSPARWSRTEPPSSMSRIPRPPQYLAHIPGEGKERTGESGGASMVRVCSGNDLPHGVKNKFYMLRAYGNSAHEMWDVTGSSPNSSRMNVIVKAGLRDTHKSSVGMRYRHQLISSPASSGGVSLAWRKSTI